MTDETFVIEQGDTMLDQPSILWLRALERYLAVRGESVALLKEFDDIRAGKAAVALQWEVA